MDWYVYIILCSDNSLYTGISKDVQKRFTQHASQKGAKYFRGRKPLKLVYQEGGHNRSTASKREIEIKQLSKIQKEKLIESVNNR